MPKISGLPPMNSPADDDVLAIDDDSVADPTSPDKTKKISLSTLRTWLQSLTDWISSTMLVESFIKGRRQDDNNDSISNAMVGDNLIQFGWGQVLGNDTSTVDSAVTFPVAFSAPPIVVITPLGGKTGTAIDITEAGLTSNAPVPQAGGITTTGFSVRLFRTSGTLTSTARWAYTWIAIGPS